LERFPNTGKRERGQKGEGKKGGGPLFPLNIGGEKRGRGTQRKKKGGKGGDKCVIWGLVWEGEEEKSFRLVGAREEKKGKHRRSQGEGKKRVEI